MHESHPVFTMRNDPMEIPFDVRMLPYFRILLGGAVTDPIDPTLTMIGIWETEWASEYPILRLVLSPVRQHAALIGTAALGDADSFTLNFTDLFPFLGKDCPSTLLSPLLLPSSRVLQLYHQLFMTLDTGYCLLEGVREYPSDPFRRIGQMLQKGTGICSDRGLACDEALELVTHLLKPRVVDLEWKAFILLWNKVATAQTKEGAAKSVLDLEGLIAIYDSLQATCRLKWGRGIT